MLQYASVEDVYPQQAESNRDHRRRRRKEEPNESLSSPDAVTEKSPISTHRTVVSPIEPSVLSSLHPEVVRMIPYAVLIFCCIITGLLFEIRGSLVKINEALQTRRFRY